MIVINKNSYFKFSAGEVHCKVKEAPDSSIVLKDYSMDGIMALAQHVDVWRRQGFFVPKLVIPYLPYSRQDRFINEDEPFSLYQYASIVNSLGLPRVTTFDCHSDVGLGLINNCFNISQHELINEVLPEEAFSAEDCIFVSPDAGAYKKVSKLMPNNKRIAIGIKERNSKGEIISTNVFSTVDLKDKTCIVVDDICDGGKTFIELAKALNSKGATDLYLYVTHGIFAKGLDELLKYYTTIYTTDSFDHSRFKDNEKLIVKELKNVYN